MPFGTGVHHSHMDVPVPHADQCSDTTCFQFPVLNWLFAVYSQTTTLYADLVYW